MVKNECGDVAAFPSTLDAFDLAFDPRDALRFGTAPEERGIERRIEVVGVDEVSNRARRMANADHPVGARCNLVEIVEPKIVRCSRELGAKPKVAERMDSDGAPEQAEAVHVTVSGIAPADELDAEFEGRIGLGEERRFVDAECVIEVMDLRDRRLTDADRSDRVGLNQSDSRR
jgi:hypothetical protein